MNNELAKKIEEGMKPFDCVASVREGFIRVWNCMGAYNRKLDEVTESLGMKWNRVQTSGPIGGSDWEDRVTMKEVGR